MTERPSRKADSRIASYWQYLEWRVGGEYSRWDRRGGHITQSHGNDWAFYFKFVTGSFGESARAHRQSQTVPKWGVRVKRKLKITHYTQD